MTPLSSAQAEALAALQEACATPYAQEPLIAIVTGFSGTGKSALVARARAGLEAGGALVIDDVATIAAFSSSARGRHGILAHRGQIVVAAGLQDAQSLTSCMRRSHPPESYDDYDPEVAYDRMTPRTIRVVDVLGMDMEEIAAYARDRHSRLPGPLVRCSVGLPGLADHLASFLSLDEQGAGRLAAHHLRHCIPGHQPGEHLERFLKIAPSDAMMQVIESYRQPEHIYDLLAEMHARDSSDFTFVVPESAALYSETLGPRGGRIRSVSLLVPGLSPERFADVGDVLGFANDRTFRGRSQRWTPFGVTAKELQIYAKIRDEELLVSESKALRCEEGNVSSYEWGSGEAIKAIDDYWFISLLKDGRRAAQTWTAVCGEYLPPAPGGSALFRVSVNDHGGANDQPTQLGWMLESFLQHRGIPYLATMCVGSRYQQTSYLYTPQAGLEMLEKNPLHR